MPRKPPMPRKGSHFGMPIHNLEMSDGTWLEGEEFAYPKGGFTRRAYVRLTNGTKKVVACSIADTFFSLPTRCRVKGKYTKGFLSVNSENVLVFTQTDK